MKRYITLLLALLMVMLPLAACADKPDEGNNGGNVTGGSDTSGGTNEPGSDPSEVLEVPENLNYGGTFEILSPEAVPYNYYSVDFDEPSEDPLANAIYLRNIAAEDYLGIEIHTTEAAHGEPLYKMFKTSVDAASGDFDAIFNSMQYSATAVGAGLCIPFEDLYYVNLDKAWWNDDCSEQLAIGGKHYMISGDIAVSDKECIWMVYFTKDLIEENGLENPYDLVENNQWTWDKMHEMAADAAFDANANDKLDKDGKDVWGVTTHNENWAAMWQAAGLKLITLDSDGIPEISWDSERFFDVYSDIVEFMSDTSCVSPDDDVFIKTAFPAGKTLFATEVVAHIRNYRENEYDFGVVPFPKYDTTTERYNSYVAVSSAVLSIGFDNNNLERTGAILETMGAYGRKEITPVYYEEQIKSRFARDEQTADMLDIIFEYRSYDLGVFFNWGNAYSNLIGGKQNPSQLIASSRKSLTKDMQKALGSLGLF